jgi:hypothetical protein
MAQSRHSSRPNRRGAASSQRKDSLFSTMTGLLGEFEETGGRASIAMNEDDYDYALELRPDEEYR